MHNRKIVMCKRCGEECLGMKEFNWHRWRVHREEMLDQLTAARAKQRAPGEATGGQPISDKQAASQGKVSFEEELLAIGKRMLALIERDESPIGGLFIPLFREELSRYEAAHFAPKPPPPQAVSTPIFESMLDSISRGVIEVEEALLGNTPPRGNEKSKEEAFLPVAEWLLRLTIEENAKVKASLARIEAYQDLTKQLEAVLGIE